MKRSKYKNLYSRWTLLQTWPQPGTNRCNRLLRKETQTSVNPKLRQSIWNCRWKRPIGPKFRPTSRSSPNRTSQAPLYHQEFKANIPNPITLVVCRPLTWGQQFPRSSWNSSNHSRGNNPIGTINNHRTRFSPLTINLTRLWTPCGCLCLTSWSTLTPTSSEVSDENIYSYFAYSNEFC